MGVSSLTAWNENSSPSLLQNNALEDLYDADEFGLYFRLMPEKCMNSGMVASSASARMQQVRKNENFLS